MDRERIKLIVENLEILLDQLKEEIYSDGEETYHIESFSSPDIDYDEIFDEDGYSD
jgi:hypothetical protein